MFIKNNTKVKMTRRSRMEISKRRSADYICKAKIRSDKFSNVPNQSKSKFFNFIEFEKANSGR